MRLSIDDEMTIHWRAHNIHVIIWRSLPELRDGYEMAGAAGIAVTLGVITTANGITTSR